jgi:hypothetical protein
MNVDLDESARPSNIAGIMRFQVADAVSESDRINIHINKRMYIELDA